MLPIQKQLLEEAKRAAEKYSHSPYSRYRVGAAVLADGKIYPGANIENASSNLGSCAERVAISHAHMNGATRIEGIGIYCLDAPKDEDGRPQVGYTMPCGGCLQWIAELAPEAWIVTNGVDDPMTLDDLMPRPFQLLSRSGKRS